MVANNKVIIKKKKGQTFFSYISHDKILLLLASSFLIISSCQKQIEIDLEHTKPTPVISCFFSPDSVFSIKLSFTKKITDFENKLIKNAEVNIYSENSDTIKCLYTWQNGIFKSKEKPVANTTYKLVVKIEDYPTISAYDKIPQSTPITDVEYLNQYDPASSEDVQMSSVFFKDDIEIENFYNCSVFGFWNDTIYYHGGYFDISLIKDPIILAEGDLQYHPQSFFFSDITINGQSTSLTIPYGSDNDIELRTTSKNYYLYQKYWVKHLYNQQNDNNASNATYEFDVLPLLFMGEPVEMFTNIENGLGIFAGYSADRWYTK